MLRCGAQPNLTRTSGTIGFLPTPDPQAPGPPPAPSVPDGLPPAAPLLADLRVVDAGGTATALAGRVLADLGAAVTCVEGPGGHPLRAEPHRFAAWTARSHLVAVAAPDDPGLLALVRGADAVLHAPGQPGDLGLDPAVAPERVWVAVTPFGTDGPRAAWRASDLGVLAASGNLYCTGDPDRPPVRCAEPVSAAHTGPEAAFALLSALATGRPQRVDVSMQETVCSANMATPARFPDTGFRGRRRGDRIGPSREIWRTADGWVSFGLRGGPARVPGLRLLAGLVGTPRWRQQDWDRWSPARADRDALAGIETDLEAFFAARTTAELFRLAAEHHLMLAPVRGPAEILACEQLAARSFFATGPGGRRLPAGFAAIRLGPPTATVAAPAASSVAPGGPGPWAAVPAAGPHRPAWAGTRILELGAGAAGPLATRAFAEHGACVLRIESRARPDFLRLYALGPDTPHGLEGSAMFDGLNAGKRSVAINLKHPEGCDLARRLALEWADAVVENFAPRALAGLGLDHASLAAERPDLVMASSSLCGQRGPLRDYPGFGGQGAALAGYNFLTGWPDRAPVGPHGTITDSLAPRFLAAALAAALRWRRRTGRGCYVDLSQVEAAVYTLTPWLLAFQADGVVRGRRGNDDPAAALHGLFACRPEPGPGGTPLDDRWVAVAAWDDDELARLHAVTGGDVAGWCAGRTRTEVADTLQAAGLEAVPVADFGDLHDDPQLAHRGHFQPLEHPVLGPGLYERGGFRLSDAPAGYDRPGPTLGQDTERVCADLLGLGASEQARLADTLA